MASSKRKNLKRQTVNPSRIVYLGLLGFILIILAFIIVRLWVWLTSTAMSDASIGIPSVKYLDLDTQVNLFMKPNWLIGIDGKNNIIKYTQVSGNLVTNNLRLLSTDRKIVIDGYIYIPKELNSIEDVSSYFRNAIFNSNLQTNFSHLQLIQIWWEVRNYMLIQKQGNISLPEDEILNNNFTISILNGTNQPGLATIGSEWVENLGTDVIEVGNSNQTFEVSTITVYRKEDGNPLYKRLERIYNCPLIFNNDDDNKPFDIQIIIGLDFSQSGN